MKKHRSAYKPVIICNCKQGHYSDRKIWEMMILSELIRAVTCMQISLSLLSKSMQGIGKDLHRVFT
jgi:hypothetical protein